MGLDRLTTRQFDLFRGFIYETSGIHVDDRKVTLLSNRIRRRVRARNFEGFDAYYRFLTSSDGADELPGFLDAITTNETFFFRNPRHFDWLKTQWLDEQVLLHRAGKREARLRIWSAGCSIGAEAYSIAICLAENKYRLRDWSLNVTGTDISEEVLQEARQALYRPRTMQGVSEQQRKRFFQHKTSEDLWQVRPAIKELVTFNQHNLLNPAAESKFDCIFIRNVLIYFDQISKQTAVDHLIRGLANGGYLVVGPSEGIYDMLHGLTRITPLIYQKTDQPTRHIEAGHDD